MCSVCRALISAKNSSIFGGRYWCWKQLTVQTGNASNVFAFTNDFRAEVKWDKTTTTIYDQQEESETLGLCINVIIYKELLPALKRQEKALAPKYHSANSLLQFSLCSVIRASNKAPDNLSFATDWSNCLTLLKANCRRWLHEALFEATEIFPAATA